MKVLNDASEAIISWKKVTTPAKAQSRRHLGNIVNTDFRVTSKLPRETQPIKMSELAASEQTTLQNKQQAQSAAGGANGANDCSSPVQQTERN